MFSQTESGKISDEYVAVKLTGGADMTPELEQFMSRYGVRGYPTLFVMNAEGHVVSSQVGRSTEGILDSLRKGEASEAEFAKLAAAAGAEDASDEKVAEYVEALESRMAWDTLLERLEGQERSAERDDKVATVYAKLGRSDDELALRAEMVELYPDADDRSQWRIRLATAPMDAVKSREAFTATAPGVAAKLLELATKAKEEGDTATTARALVEAGNLLSHPLVGKATEGQAKFEQVLSEHEDSEAAPDALMGMVNISWRAKDYPRCKELLERIRDEYPSSEHGKNAPRLIQRVEQMIAGGR